MFCVNNDLIFFYPKAWLCKCGFNHHVFSLLCWYLICMQPLSLPAPRRAEVHIMFFSPPRTLLWIFQTNATNVGENLDGDSWINQCCGLSQKEPCIRFKEKELVSQTHMGKALLSSTSLEVKSMLQVLTFLWIFLNDMCEIRGASIKK